MRHHRRPPMPPRQPQGVCQWCAGAILHPEGHKKAGQPNTRRTWHAECATKYLVATQSQAQRNACWARDQGKCAACRVVAIGLRFRRGPTVYMWGYQTGEYCPVWPVRDDRWDADHIRPLWSAPADVALDERDAWFGLENLQTLCRACHKAKSAREARRRADERRPALPLLARAA